MSLYDDASLIAYPSGYKESKIYTQKPVPSYGAELVTNGDFSNGTNGWQGTDGASLLSVVSGELKIENGDGSAAGANSSITTEIGKKYRITFQDRPQVPPQLLSLLPYLQEETEALQKKTY